MAGQHRYRLLAWLALLVWVMALFMPLQSGELADHRQANGLAALLFAWLEHPAWLANIGFLWTIVLLARHSPPPRRTSLIVAGSTAALALSALTWDNALDEFQAAQQFAVHFGIGFYVWIATNVAAAAALVARAWGRREVNPPDDAATAETSSSPQRLEGR